MLIPMIGMANTPGTMRVASLTGNVGLAMVKIMEQPILDKVTVNFEIFQSPDPVLGKLITGEVDAAGLPTNVAAMLYNKKVDIQVAAIIGWGVMYVVSGDPKIKDWQDLKGKEVYVASKGAVSDLLFQYLVSKNGLKPNSDLKIQYLASAVEIAQLASAGKITSAAIPEPWATEALLKNPQLRVALDFQQEWKRVERQGLTYPQTCIVVRKKFAQEHPALVQQFLKRLSQSISWGNQNPKEAGVLAEKYIQIPAITAEKGMKRSNLKYLDAYKVKVEVKQFLQRLVEFAPEAVGGKVPDEAFFYQP